MKITNSFANYEAGDLLIDALPDDPRLFVCPQCERIWPMHPDHKLVIEDGLPTVIGSAVCPNQRCRAHYLIQKGSIILL